MNTEVKAGLVLSSSRAVGTCQTGMVKTLTECSTWANMTSKASIGALNGTIIVTSPDLPEAAVRLEMLWDHLRNNQVLSVNRLVYFSLLKGLFQTMNLCQILGRAGVLLTTLLHRISILDGFGSLVAQPLLPGKPLVALLDHYLDTDALADGLPLHVSLYPTERGIQNIINCIRTELGVGTMKNAAFQHTQNLFHGQQKETLLTSTVLPLLFRSREVQGAMLGNGSIGGQRNMQENTPVTPLINAGCNIVIATHLNNGSLWDRQASSDTTVLEIHPRRKLKRAGNGNNSDGLLSFTLAHADAWRQQGYEGTILATEHIRRPPAAHQVLSRSETVLQKGLEIMGKTDLALRNAMARIKQRRPKETPPSVTVFLPAGITESTFRYILPEGRFYPSPVSSPTGNLVVQLPARLSMSLVLLVNTITRAGKYKNYVRNEIKCWQYVSYKGREFPEDFTDEKFSNTIYNGRMLTMERLHTLILPLAVLLTGFSVEAASVEQAFSRNPNTRVEWPRACPTTYELYGGDAAHKAALDKALEPVGLSGIFGKSGCIDGPGGSVTPVTTNGTVWFQGDGRKANTCDWGFIITLYNPKTHGAAGYHYFSLDDPACLVWSGETGAHEFTYLVKNCVATVN